MRSYRQKEYKLYLNMERELQEPAYDVRLIPHAWPNREPGNIARTWCEENQR